MLAASVKHHARVQLEGKSSKISSSPPSAAAWGRCRELCRLLAQGCFASPRTELAPVAAQG